MLSRSEEYWSKAAECERLAVQITSPLEKRVMLEQARQWRILAKQAERQGL